VRKQQRRKAMIRSVKVLFLTIGLSLVFSTVARSQCPAGFEFAGRLYASTGPGGSGNHEFKGYRDVSLPAGTKLDKSYHQATVNGAGGGASTALQASQIPAAIHIVPGGSEGGPKRWAVSDPKLEAVAYDDSDRVTQWKFSMYMYADAGSGTLDGVSSGGADVHVDVCFKPKP
jgi:hypothetical protein